MLYSLICLILKVESVVLSKLTQVSCYLVFWFNLLLRLSTDSLTWLWIIITGASGLVHFDEDGERNLDYSIYDLQHTGEIIKFVPILHFDSHSRNLR